MKPHPRFASAWLVGIALLLVVGAGPAFAARPIQMRVDTLAVSARQLDVTVSIDGAWRLYADLTKVEAGLETADGSIWFTAGGHVLRMREGMWMEFAQPEGPLVDGALRTLACAPDGDLWFTGSHESSAAAVKYDGTSWVRYSHPGETIAFESAGQGAVVDDAGRLWMAAEHISGTGLSARLDSSAGGGGVLRFSETGWERLDVSDGLGHNRTYDMALDANGRIQVSHHWGVSTFDGERFDTRRLDYKVHDIALGPDGATWCNHGYPGGGITILREGPSTYLDAAGGLPVHVLRRMLPAGDGVWIGTAREHFELFGSEGVVFGDGMQWLRIGALEGLPGRTAFPVTASSDGRTWFNVEGAGLASYRLDLDRLGTVSGTVVRPDGAPWKGAGVYAFRDSAWVHAGAAVRDDGTFDLRVLPGTYDVGVAFADDGERNVVEVTSGGAVNGLSFAPTSITPPEPPSVGPPDWFIWIVGGIIVLLIAAVIGLPIWFWRRRRRRQDSVSRGPDPAFPNIRQSIGLLAMLLLLTILLGIPAGAINAALGGGLVLHPALLALVNLGAFWMVIRIGLRRVGATWREALPLSPVGGDVLAAVAVSIVGMSVLLSDLGNLFQQLLPIPPELVRVFKELAGAQGGAWGSVLALVVVAPLTEELLFRGLILRGFLKRYSVRKAILVSALLFGLIHMNPWQALGGGIIGVFLGWLYVRTGSLVPCIAAHAVNNAIPVVLVGILGLQIEGMTSDPTEMAFQPLWLDLLGLALAGGGLRWLMGRLRREGKAAGGPSV